MEESKELTMYGSKPLTVQDIKAQIDLLQDVLKNVMQKDQHYGIIPGTGNKPTLLKPGAEKIMATFRLVADPQVEDLSKDNILRYRIKCNILTMSGVFIGAGVGESSSEEEKYKWRYAINEKEFDQTPENLRRIKITRDKEIKQIRTNPYDLANTLLKMAKKRALIDGVLTATAASDIFTQDIEEMLEEIINPIQKTTQISPQKPKIKEPLSKSTEPQVKTIHTIISKKGFDEANIKKILGIGHFTELNKGAAGFLIEFLSKHDEFTPEELYKDLEVMDEIIFKEANNG